MSLACSTMPAMRLLLPPHDSVEVSIGALFGQVRSGLAGIGRPDLTHARFWCAGRLLTDDHPIGTPPLVDGARLVVLPPGSPWRPEAPSADLAVVAAGDIRTRAPANSGALGKFARSSPIADSTHPVGSTHLPQSTRAVARHRPGGTGAMHLNAAVPALPQRLPVELPPPAPHMAVLTGPCEGWVVAAQGAVIQTGPGTAYPFLPTVHLRRVGMWWLRGISIIRPGRPFTIADVDLVVRPGRTRARGRLGIVGLGVAIGILMAVLMRNPLFALFSLSGVAGFFLRTPGPNRAPLPEDAAGLAVALARGEDVPVSLRCEVSTHVTADQSNVQQALGSALPVVAVHALADMEQIARQARAAPVLLVTEVARPSWAADGTGLPAAGASWLRTIRSATTPRVWLPTALSVADCPSFSHSAPRGTPELATVIGHDGHDEVWLNLTSDGPHAVIAGTTGSGKSALLRTLILGLAVRHPPADLAFVLIDFKGGTSLGAVSRLPHVAERVSNADVSTAARALAGLARVVRDRSSLMRQWSVSQWPELLALARKGRLPDGAPVPPRLVIVVDEFRELTVDLPDFLTDLVRVAAQGRSLGVHLILATQRPAGAISAEIRANMAIRIALRTTSDADSVDIVGLPDAAHFTVPGRAVLATGQDVRTIQVASTQVAPTPPVRRPSTPLPTSDLEERLVAQVLTQAPARAQHLWAPAVPPSPAPHRWQTTAAAVAIGIIDDLSTSRWVPAIWRPPDGHLGVDGPDAAAALDSLAASSARAGLIVHAVGLDPELIPASHRGTFTGFGSPLIPQLLLRLLDQPISPTPRHVLVVPNWATVQSGLESAGRRAGDLLERLLHLGPARGVHLIGQATSRSFTVRIDAGQAPERPADRRIRAAVTAPAWLSTSATSQPCTLFAPTCEPLQQPVADPIRIRDIPRYVPPLDHAGHIPPTSKHRNHTLRPAGWPRHQHEWLIGLGSEGPVTAPAASLLVVGLPGSGRTTAVQTLARASGLKTVSLSSLDLTSATGEDIIVLADDLDLLLTGDPVLEAELTAALPRLRLIASAATARALRDLRGPLAALRQAQRGVVLSPTPGCDEVFGVEVWPYVDPGAGPGYGVLVTGRQVTPVRLSQAASAPAAARHRLD